MALETIADATSRNRTGSLYVAIGVLLMLASIADDGAGAPTWGALLTPHAVFGILGHAAGAALLYLGAKRQDP